MSIFELEKDKAYLLLPYGIGDTIIMCNLYNTLIEKFKKDIVYIIKPSHKVVMDTYNIGSFICADTEALLNDTRICFVDSVEEGKIYIAHRAFHKNSVLEDKKTSSKFYNYYLNFWGIEKNIKLKTPQIIPSISKKTKDKLENKDISRTTLYAPDCNSYYKKKVMHDYFKKEIALSNKTNLIVNTFYDDEQFNEYKIELDIDELIAISAHCKKVVSVRSGLCDFIYNIVNDMEVIYPSEEYYDSYNLKDLYGENHNVKEKIFGLVDQLKLMGYSNCAIYGYGKKGTEMEKKFNKENFNILYFIDKNENVRHVEKKVYHSLEKIPKADVMIVSVVNDVEKIVEEVRNNCDMPVYAPFLRE